MYVRKISRISVLLVVLFSVLMMASVVIGQDVLPEATPEVIPIILEIEAPPVAIVDEPVVIETMPLSSAFEAFITLIAKITFSPGTAFAVITITATLKIWLPYDPAKIAFAVQVLLWALVTVVTYAGHGPAFDNALTAFVEILATVTGFVTSAGLAQGGYKLLNKLEVPVLGAGSKASRFSHG